MKIEIFKKDKNEIDRIIFVIPNYSILDLIFLKFENLKWFFLDGSFNDILFKFLLLKYFKVNKKIEKIISEIDYVDFPLKSDLSFIFQIDKNKGNTSLFGNSSSFFEKEKLNRNIKKGKNNLENFKNFSKELNKELNGKVSLITHLKHINLFKDLFNKTNYFPVVGLNNMENENCLAVLGSNIFPIDAYYKSCLYFLDTKGNFIKNTEFKFPDINNKISAYFDFFQKWIRINKISNQKYQAIGRIRPFTSNKFKFIINFGYIPNEFFEKNKVYKVKSHSGNLKFLFEEILCMIIKINNPNKYELKDNQNFYFIKDNENDYNYLKITIQKNGNINIGNLIHKYLQLNEKTYNLGNVTGIWKFNDLKKYNILKINKENLFSLILEN